jgi:hypothetical protein
MIFSLSLRTRCATASSRGSAAVAPWAAPPFDERARLLDARAPLLDERVRARLLVPLLLLFVVRRVVPLARLLLLEPDPLERREELLPDDEPPELEPEPLLLAWGMPSS